MQVQRCQNALASRIDIVGTRISVVTMPIVLTAIESWLSERNGRCILCRDVHGVIRARTDRALHAVNESADLVTPDGMPLVWTAKLFGNPHISRVCGPDLMLAVIERGLTLGWKHYFYGSSPQVLEALLRELASMFPGMKVVGSFSPSYRAQTEEEENAACDRIRTSGADCVWVGLGSPKQDYWVARNAKRCGGAVLFAVGAAFDFHAGTVCRAPVWMQKRGVEWVYRIFKEPRRLWRRYLVTVPQFIVLAFAQTVKFNVFGVSRYKIKFKVPSGAGSGKA